MAALLNGVIVPQINIKQYKKRNKSVFNTDDIVGIEDLGPLTLDRGKSVSESVVVTLSDGSTHHLESEPFNEALKKAKLL